MEYIYCEESVHPSKSYGMLTVRDTKPKHLCSNSEAGSAAEPQYISLGRGTIYIIGTMGGGRPGSAFLTSSAGLKEVSNHFGRREGPAQTPAGREQQCGTAARTPAHCGKGPATRRVAVPAAPRREGRPCHFRAPGPRAAAAALLDPFGIKDSRQASQICVQEE